MINKVIFHPPEAQSNRVLFLDRDGVINKKPPEHDYVKTWSEFSFNPGIFKNVRYANERGILVIVITNQRGIGRGLLTIEDFMEITNKMVDEFYRQACEISAVYYCPHNFEDNCVCRKPNPGLLHEAVSDFRVNKQKSFLVSDSKTDIEMAKRFGIDQVLLTSSDSEIDYLDFLTRV